MGLRDNQWLNSVVSNFTKFEKIFIGTYAVIVFIYSFYIYTVNPHAESFLLPYALPVILYFRKNHLFFPILVAVFPITISFWMLGAPIIVAVYLSALFVGIYTISSVLGGYYLAIISLFLYIIPSIQGKNLIDVIVFFILIGILVSGKVYKTVITPEIKKFGILLSILFLYINFSIIWSVGFYDYILCYFDILTIFMIFFWTVLLIDTEERMITVFKVWAIIGLIYAVSRIFIQPSTDSNIGLYAAKNTVSSLLNFSFFSLVALHSLKIRYRFFPLAGYYLLFALIIGINIIVGSRAGLSTMIMGFILFYLFKNNEKSKFKRFLIRATTGFIIIFLIAQVVLIPLLYMKLQYSPVPFEDSAAIQSIVFRFYQWDIAGQMIEDYGNHIFGLGINGYATHYYEYYSLAEQYEPWMAHPHSMYVYVYTDYGIIGYLIFAAILIMFFIYLQKRVLYGRSNSIKLMALAVYIAVFSFMIHALVDWALIDERFWMFLGYGMALICIEKQQVEESLSLPTDVVEEANV